MRFLYFYSPFYQFYYEHLQDCLSSHFEVEPILIEDIQEKQNKSLHHFDGLTIKLELIIEAIKRYMGEVIIFSDATIFMNKNKAHELKDYFLLYSHFDLVFVNEGPNGINIGLIQINCSEKTLDFFSRSLQIMKDGKQTHDQNAIKHAVHESHDLQLTLSLYDERIMCDYFNESLRENFFIFKSFISNRGKESNFNQRIQKFYDLKLIDEPTYHKWIIKNERNEIIW